MSESTHDRVFRRVGEDLGIPPGLLKACGIAESNLNPKAYRAEPHLGDESRGIMQILTSTARDYGVHPESLWDPTTNIETGGLHLARMYSCYWEIPEDGERWRFAVAAYNAGRGNINKALASFRRELGVSIETPGVWQTWEVTGSRHLPGITGKASQVTLEHVSRVWRLWGQVEATWARGAA